MALIRDLMNGRKVEWNGKELQLEWAQGRETIPIYVAGYGPKALGVAGRQGDGVVIQLADLDIIDWIMDQARSAAEADGRDPSVLEPVVCAPAVISDDIAAAREAVRWFPAMVSNHVMDLLRRYDQSMLPESLTGYLTRREGYDYGDHSRAAPSTASSSTTRRATASGSSAPSRTTSRSCASSRSTACASSTSTS